MLFRALIGIALVAAPGVAFAQASQCRLPERIARPRAEGPTAQEPRRLLTIGSYTLAVSWSPQYCATSRGGRRDALQCGSANRFGFTLHGLWPDGRGKDWPQYCKPAKLLPTATIRRHLCATPSVQLVQHEWAKHGTCMNTTPERYLALSRKLYAGLRYPDMERLAARGTLTVRAFTKAFAAQNAGMTADMLRLNVTRGGRLSEVWVCLDRRLRYTRCPAHQGGARDSARLAITPRA